MMNGGLFVLFPNSLSSYDPKTDWYLQTDPAGDGLNLYTYVGGNSVNVIDPQGLSAARMVGGVAAIAADVRRMERPLASVR